MLSSSGVIWYSRKHRQFNIIWYKCCCFSGSYGWRLCEICRQRNEVLPTVCLGVSPVRGKHISHEFRLLAVQRAQTKFTRFSVDDFIPCRKPKQKTKKKKTVIPDIVASHQLALEEKKLGHNDVFRTQGQERRAVGQEHEAPIRVVRSPFSPLSFRPRQRKRFDAKKVSHWR